MKLFVYNILLAFIWAVMNGAVNQRNLGIGFLVGFGILGAVRSDGQAASYFRKMARAIGFALYFIKEMAVSTVRVTYDVLTPTLYTRPGIIAIPLDAKTDAEITVLANVISLTPGTLSLDVSPDRKTLYLHAMFIDDPDQLRREIKEGMEARVLGVMR